MSWLYVCTYDGVMLDDGDDGVILDDSYDYDNSDDNDRVNDI